jgi:adenylate kinase
MLGPPGAGKGTQAERFARLNNIPKISTGDILREAVTEGSELGRIAKATMDAGKLVGDDVMIGIVKERLSRPDARNGFVLDGFPRTVAQAQALDVMINGRGPLVEYYRTRRSLHVVDGNRPQSEVAAAIDAAVGSACGGKRQGDA